jgi:hypothetical protein
MTDSVIFFMETSDLITPPKSVVCPVLQQGIPKKLAPVVAIAGFPTGASSSD